MHAHARWDTQCNCGESRVWTTKPRFWTTSWTWKLWFKTFSPPLVLELTPQVETRLLPGGSCNSLRARMEFFFSLTRLWKFPNNMQ